jgi:hypothetical protein
MQILCLSPKGEFWHNGAHKHSFPVKQALALSKKVLSNEKGLSQRSHVSEFPELPMHYPFPFASYSSYNRSMHPSEVFSHLP